MKASARDSGWERNLQILSAACDGLPRLGENSTHVAQLAKNMPQGLKPALILQSLQRD